MPVIGAFMLALVTHAAVLKDVLNGFLGKTKLAH